MAANPGTRLKGPAMNIHRLYGAIARRFRTRRMADLIRQYQVTEETRILDVGGTLFNWELIAVRPRITIVKLEWSPGAPTEIEYGARRLLGREARCDPHLLRPGRHRPRRSAGLAATPGRITTAQRIRRSTMNSTTKPKGGSMSADTDSGRKASTTRPDRSSPRRLGVSSAVLFP